MKDEIEITPFWVYNQKRVVVNERAAKVEMAVVPDSEDEAEPVEAQEDEEESDVSGGEDEGDETMMGMDGSDAGSDADDVVGEFVMSDEE
jgi:hypothetical protein